MSSFDRVRPKRLGAALFVLAAATLAACTVQPVYAPQYALGTTGKSASLTHVAIDPVDERVAQVVRNKLMFGLNGGPTVANPVYHMRLVTSETEIPLGVSNIEAAPTYSVTVAVTYELTKVGSNQILLRNTSRGSASYDRVNSAFANTRAKIDAENRAAEVVADDIRLRVAAAAAKGFR
jgi:LPS-assembly lipoprotein